MHRAIQGIVGAAPNARQRHPNPRRQHQLLPQIPESCRPNMEEGISLFSSLLNNKHFLIVFVHALEQQKDFAVRDRSGCEALGEGQGPAGGHTACRGLA